MALYHVWDAKNGSTYVLQFFSLISDGIGGVQGLLRDHPQEASAFFPDFDPPPSPSSFLVPSVGNFDQF